MTDRLTDSDCILNGKITKYYYFIYFQYNSIQFHVISISLLRFISISISSYKVSDANAPHTNILFFCFFSFFFCSFSFFFSFFFCLLLLPSSFAFFFCLLLPFFFCYNLFLYFHSCSAFIFLYYLYYYSFRSQRFNLQIQTSFAFFDFSCFTIHLRNIDCFTIHI